MRLWICCKADNQTKVEVRFVSETVWLNRHQLANLFGRNIKTIGKHIGNIFKEGELPSAAVVKESLTTAADGKRYYTKFYNLDVIISVGYRVKSLRGTQFRQWATQRLKEYLLEGYALNSKRLEELGKVAHFIEQGSQNETFGLRAKTAPPFSAAPVPHGQPRTVRR